MIHSMTAFGRAVAETPWGSLVSELRSVNHRYLEIIIRLPEELRALEPEIRRLLGRRLGRGKVDCNLRFQRETTATSELEIDSAMVDRLANVAQAVTERAPHIAPLGVADILQWPGVLQSRELDADDLGRQALALLEEAVKELLDTRRREGERINELISQRLQAAEAIVADVKTVLPEARSAYRERIRDRLSEIKQDLDPARLEQEVVMFAQKADIDEETDRLATHLAEVRRVLDQGGQIGRRLDFLMQELNREANTLGAKAVDIRITNTSVELKVLIEQMREQIQNVE